MDRRPILAISMGDPAGIGAEIAVKALLEADLLRRQTSWSATSTASPTPYPSPARMSP